MAAPDYLTLDPQTQARTDAVRHAASLFAQSTEQDQGQPFDNIIYVKGGTGSKPVPGAFLLEGVTAHLHLDVTLGLNGGAAPALSFLNVLTAIENITFRYNGSKGVIWSTDSIYADQRYRMEYPSSDIEAVDTIPVPAGAGTAYSYDKYFDIPAVYSEQTELGILNENSNDVHSSISVNWGDVANAFVLGTGQTATATGYIEFVARRQSVPTEPQDGEPDLSKNYVTDQVDIELSNKGDNTLKLSLSDTITRIALNWMEGDTGNGSDVASYDSTNALQVTNAKLMWGTKVVKYDLPYGFWQERMAKRYGRTMSKYINRGTIIIDLDQHGGRDWINAEDVTSLQVVLTLGATPPNGSKCRVSYEQIVNTDVTPIR